MCNIPSTNTDPQYRYKMPKIVSRTEGSGIGIRTCIVNVGEVARALYVPPQYAMKWFGLELGAQSSYTNKKDEGERAVIRGAHETKVFQALLDKFIKKYVLCPSCDLPEILLRIKKDRISAKCAACGWSGEVDNSNRLAAFITKNPPDGNGGVVSAAERAKKHKKKKPEDDDEVGIMEEKEEKKDKQNERSEKKEKHDDDGQVRMKKDKQERKEKKEKRDKKEEEEEQKINKKEKREKRETKVKKEEKDGKVDGDLEVDMASKDGKVSKPSFVFAAKDGAVFQFDDEIKSTIRSLTYFVDSKDGTPTVSGFFEEVRALQVTKVFDHNVRLYVVLEALFRDSMDAKSVRAKTKLLDKFITNGSLETRDILWAFGAYLEANKGWDAARCFPPVVKGLYDEDWCTEKGLLSYYNNNEGNREPGFERAKVAVQPLLTWLAQDADNSDSEEVESKEEHD